MDANTSTYELSGCNICYKTKDTPDMLTTSCGHIFCSECFFKWLKEKPNCPICRAQFTTPLSGELEEELEHLHHDIEEYTSYRELLTQGIIIEEERLKNIYDRESNKINTLNAEKHQLGRDITVLKEKVNNIMQIYQHIMNEYAVKQQHRKKNNMMGLIFKMR